MNEKELNARRLGAISGMNPYDDAFKTEEVDWEYEIRKARKQGRAEALKEVKNLMIELEESYVVDIKGYKWIELKTKLAEMEKGK